jgi:hypothetical protein
LLSKPAPPHAGNPLATPQNCVPTGKHAQISDRPCAACPHVDPAGQLPLHTGDPDPPSHGTKENGEGVGVELGEGVGLAHLPLPQASQQLGCWLAHAEPPLGARHSAALFLTRQCVLPLLRVVQQATALGEPHAEFAAQRLTAAPHAPDRSPASTCCATTPLAQAT